MTFQGALIQQHRCKFGGIINSGCKACAPRFERGVPIHLMINAKMISRVQLQAAIAVILVGFRQTRSFFLRQPKTGIMHLQRLK
ncbi:hypothetical protein D3C73_1549610 [compost metagenome]